MTEGNKDNSILLKRQQSEIETKIEKLEEKFIMEEIDRPLYTKFKTKYKEEMQQINASLEEMNSKSSNLSEYLEYTLEMCSNLGGYWNNLDYKTKQNLQYLVFPEGIYFDKKTGEFEPRK
jgi:site-specific DNA recombinase